jgi:hypothetical protein
MNDDYIVECFDWSLEEVKTIGQSEDVHGPFYFEDVYQNRNKKFYSRFLDSIDIVIENDGTLIERIYINNYKFIIVDDKKHLVVFSWESIDRYHLESGDFISQIDINGSIPN